MEGIVQSLYLTKFPKSQTCSASLLNSPLLFHSNATSVTFNSASHHWPKCFLFQLPGGVRPKAKEKGNLEGGAIHASEAATPTTTNATERWLLEPIGDGDTRHIGFKVEMPGAYEIASSEVTVGRVPDKADLVIPVATVSGVHARIQKKQGNLLVTDLDSTNGTFIDDQRLRPGVVATVSSGSCITFGDTHLAMFRVSKVEDEKTADTAGETEGVYTKRGLRAVPTGLKLDPRQEYDLNVPDSWSGTVWARTGCSGNPNATFHCATGDCGTNKLHCHYNTPHPPVTLAKFTIAPKGGTSSYKVDLRYGFNLPLTLTPFDSKCQKIKCFRDWRNQCPDWLAVYSNDGRKIACKSACFTTGEPKHCCTGAFASPQKCELNPYTELVENQCPSAVSNAFDDTHFTCFGGISYMITFCT